MSMNRIASATHQSYYRRLHFIFCTLTLITTVTLLYGLICKFLQVMTFASADGLNADTCNYNGSNAQAPQYIPRFKVRRLPHCLIIGVKKGGTRALLTFLSLHPDVVAPDSVQNFFWFDELYEKGFEFYRQQMPPSNDNQKTLEKTAEYFSTSSVPQRVRHMNSSIRLILVVRDPVTRLVSEYTEQKSHSSKNPYPPLESFLLDQNGNVNKDYGPVNVSTYSIHYKNWLSYFPRHQIHIVDGQQLIKDPYSEIYKIETFLGLGHKIPQDIFYFDNKKGFYCMAFNATRTCLKESKGRTHPDVDQEVLTKLKKYFKSFNEVFFNLAKRRFDW